MAITFDEGKHIYEDDGILIPSVSSYLRLITGKTFEGIPQRILSDKAAYGTAVHEAIEQFLLTGCVPGEKTVLIRESVLEAKRLLEGYTPVHTEQIVNFGTLYAGTFDLLAEKDDRLTLFDYKTSAQLDEEWLKWQLNAYRIAYEFETGRQIQALRAIWLPKNSYGRKVEIERMENSELIDRFLDVKRRWGYKLI